MVNGRLKLSFIELNRQTLCLKRKSFYVQDISEFSINAGISPSSTIKIIITVSWLWFEGSKSDRNGTGALMGAGYLKKYRIIHSKDNILGLPYIEDISVRIKDLIKVV